MIKKIFNILLIFALCICLTPSAFAEEEIEEIEDLDDITITQISTAKFVTNREYLGLPNTDVLINDFGAEGEKYMTF